MTFTTKTQEILKAVTEGLYNTDGLTGTELATILTILRGPDSVEEERYGFYEGPKVVTLLARSMCFPTADAFKVPNIYGRNRIWGMPWKPIESINDKALKKAGNHYYAHAEAFLHMIDWVLKDGYWTPRS